MSKYIKLNKFEDKGTYLFVYSDKFNIFFIFHSHEDNKMYMITTDKFLNIDNLDEIETPEGFFEYSDILFHKPNNDNGMYSYTGIARYSDKICRFKIDRNKLAYLNELTHINTNQFNLLTCLKDIEITSYIQKKNTLYAIGKNTKQNDSVYLVVDIEKDLMDRIYYLYSDLGDINLHSINTDVDDDRVYVVGCKKIYGDKDFYMYSVPYFEQFLLD